MVNTQNTCGMRGRSVFGREFEDVINQLFTNPERNGTGGFTPPVNIAETDDAFELLIELPGLDADAIHIEYLENVLNISGDRKQPEVPDNHRLHRVEHRYGAFQRSFRLAEIDADGITAEFVNGLLSVRAPKLPATVARKIPVTGGSKNRG